jgi:hypothetical protein
MSRFAISRDRTAWTKASVKCAAQPNESRCAREAFLHLHLLQMHKSGSSRIAVPGAERSEGPQSALCHLTRTAHSRHLPLKKGRLVTMTHDYKRHRTTTLFAALEVKWGTVIGD